MVIYPKILDFEPDALTGWNLGCLRKEDMYFACGSNKNIGAETFYGKLWQQQTFIVHTCLYSYLS